MNGGLGDDGAGGCFMDRLNGVCLGRDRWVLTRSGGNGGVVAE